MRKTLCLGTLLIAAAVTLGLDAQPTSSQPRLVTVKGCVERGASPSPAATSGTVGSAQAPGPDTKYVLTNVAAEPNPTGTTGVTRPGPVSDARSYRLDDRDASKIASHVGETVEISGTVQEQTAPAPGTTQSTAATGSTATADTIAPKISVDTIRVIASDCSKK